MVEKDLSSSKLALNDVELVLFREFLVFCGGEFDKYEKITQAGSDRLYYRFYVDKKTYLGVYSNNIPENETFLYFSKVFKSLKLNVPDVYYVSSNKTCYFIKDFGDDLLLSIVEKQTKTGSFNKKIIDLYKKSIIQLAKMQISAVAYLDFSKTYQISDFNKESILLDLNYFKYYFLNFSEIQYDDKKLQDDFNAFAQLLSDKGDKFFMFRDFQARNILIKDGEPYFIDYQGGRKGAIQYDLASLLYQAKAKIPENIKKDLLDYYIDEISTYIPVDRESFTQQYYYYVYIRVLQTLGAYGLRGLIEKRVHFIESVPFALQNLRDLLKSQPILFMYPELSRVIIELSKTKVFDQVVHSEFTIAITSFSYKKGIPNDKTANGGGFVFDCRGIHNPGRYEEYKKLNGRDKEVVAFFKENSNIDDFVSKVLETLKPTIENYIDRKFNSLTISFGCTGGQHRSVYCADKVSKYIKETYKVRVNLNHREQGISE